MNEKWSKCADAKADVLCLRVRYPWPLLPLFRAWASNRESELDAEFERQAQPLIQQFLKDSGLIWNDKEFEGITLSTFVAYYVSGGYLITPVCCYTQIPEGAKRIRIPLTAIPL